MKNIVFIFSISCLTFSCSKDDDIRDNNGVIITKKPIWVSTTTDDDQRSNNYLFKPAIYNNNGLVIRAKKNKLDVIRMLDLNTGETKWDWGDFIERVNYLGPMYPYVFNNNLIWQSDYNNYSINLDNGKTVWKNGSTENYEYRSKGVDNIFLVSHLTNRDKLTPDNGGDIVVMDAQTGKPIYAFKPVYDTIGKPSYENCGWSFQGNGVPFIRDNNIYIFIKFNDPAPSCQSIGKEWLGLFNYSKKQWVYERQKLKSSDYSFGTPHPSVIYNEKVYHGSQGVIVCHELMTGSRLWQTNVESSSFYLSAGVLVENGRVYANSDGGQLVCLDANNGRILWNISSSGTSTPLSYLNGVVYFVGGGDGKLHAVDAETGDYLWKIISPDLSKNKSAVFSGLCAVIAGKGSEKGKVVVLNGLNAYCYEAIR